MLPQIGNCLRRVLVSLLGVLCSLSFMVQLDILMPRVPRACSPAIISPPRPIPPKTTPLYHEANKQTIIIKLPNFETSDNDIEGMIKRCSNPHQNLILDLRGNPGGLVKAVQRMVGYFFG